MCDSCNGDWPEVDECEDFDEPELSDSRLICDRVTDALRAFEVFCGSNTIGLAADAFGNVRLAEAEEHDGGRDS